MLTRQCISQFTTINKVRKYYHNQSESRMSSGSLFMLVISYMLLSFRHKRQFRDRTCFRTLLIVMVFGRSHPESSSSDGRVVASIHSLNDVGCDSDSLNVTDDILMNRQGILGYAHLMHVAWHETHWLGGRVELRNPYRLSVTTSALVLSKLRLVKTLGTPLPRPRQGVQSHHRNGSVSRWRLRGV